MAEALISTLLEQLASISRTQIEQQVGLVVGVEKQVENLTLHLEAVQAVLQNAEERQVKEPDVRNWLENLKDVSHDIRDVLDDWNTEILKRQIEKREKQGQNERKVRFSTPSPCVCFGQVRHVSMRHDIAKRIIELNERLTSITSIRHNYHFERTIRAIEQLERPKTSSFVDISNIIGRETEKDMLISKLLSESSSQEGKGHLVIPIVGMGGMGKTALAQLVYKDPKVETHFENRIWVCVSDPFEEIKIAKAIIEDLNKNDTRINSNELQTLLKCISESIEGKKFLLVLDDVWNPDNAKWEQLEEALRNGAIGSRIVVTTRKEDVPIMIGATTHVVHLAGLSEQTCLSIFYHFAFFGIEKNESKMFEDIGKKIVDKCKGLPLAAKTLGSLMRNKKTMREWQHVLDSKIWELKEVEQQVFQPLLLSYYDLTPPVKRCLLYCATFPKNYVFDKDNLIEMWMSQEYLSLEISNEKKRILGQSYFDNLAMRSFFQDFGKDFSKINITTICKMHDIVHDFVQFLTKNESLIIEAYNDSERSKVRENRIRHLTLMSASDDALSFLIYNFKKLHTFIGSHLGISTINSDLILKLKYLRTLDLRHNSFKELPKEVGGGLMHLRYLDLSYNYYLETLPDTIGNLYNLQTLRLIYCNSLEKLPKTMRKLTNLKNLYISGSFHVKLPKEIATLTSLQTLDVFTVYDGGNNNETLNLGDLRNLDQLEGSLFIEQLSKIKDASEAKKAQFVNKKHLQQLHITFEEGEQRKMDEEILNALEPHTNLEELNIYYYHGTTLHLNWMMSLHNLTSLYFEFCFYCEFLPPLGKLPSLEFFKIVVFPKLKKVGVDFLGIDEAQTSSSSSYSFPKLRHLTVSGSSEWEEWEGVEGWRKEDSQITIMPSLSTLEIHLCDKLKTLPDFLWKTPLQTLQITECPILAQVFRKAEKHRGSEWPKISHIPNIHVR